MGLPKQQYSVFALEIPSTKTKVRYRGFTVKEEKILLLAKEEKELDVMINAVREIITSCIQDNINFDTLTAFDIEYIITQIRARSVGEVVELSMQCDKDENHSRIPLNIDLTKINVTFPEGHSKTIPLFDNVGIEMRYPALNELPTLEKLSGIDLIAFCINSIYTDEEIFDAKDQTKEEINAFLESLTKTQFDKINETFFNTMPHYTHEVTYTCRDCGTVHHKVIKGLANFFD